MLWIILPWGPVTLNNPKPFPRGNSCLEALVIQAATEARARWKRQAGKTLCQPAKFLSGIRILVLDFFGRNSVGALFPTHQHSNGRKGSAFGKRPCLPPLQVWEDGGAAGCQEEDPEVEMGNPLEMVLLQALLVRCHSPVVSRRNAARALPCLPAG